jgi:LacI family transcriptional regulator
MDVFQAAGSGRLDPHSERFPAALPNATVPRTIVRLKDIAEKTGFSTNTVSLALRESSRVPSETRAIIQRAARELNYLPNHVAKSLVSKETKTIGLVVTSIKNPVHTLVAELIERTLAEKGYSTLFATSREDLATEKRVIEMFQSRRVDGILIYPVSHRRIAHIKALREADFPVVMLVGVPNSGVDSVGIDDKRGGYRATRYLIELGHRRIGLFNPTDPEKNIEKFEGYLQALSEGGIPFDANLVVVPTDTSPAQGYYLMDALMALRPRPTALLNSVDALAIGALRWCQVHRVRVPEDIAIMGYDNLDSSEFASVPLSSVNYAADVVASMAVDRLMRLISSVDQLPEPRVTLIDPELVIRESTGGRNRSEINKPEGRRPAAKNETAKRRDGETANAQKQR